MQTGKMVALHDLEVRLRHKVTVFAIGYPEAWRKDTEACERPLDCLLQALVGMIQEDAVLARIARRLGAGLRRKYGYATPDGVKQASADLRRGLAWVAIDVLHGPDCTALMSGDKLTTEQVAFYFADDWWMGRDDKPIEEWADIRRVREQLMLDALDVPDNERSNMLDFSARFMQQHPDLIREAKFGLQTVGSTEGFADEVWAATGDDDLWRGVHFFAESILAGISDNSSVP